MSTVKAVVTISMAVTLTASPDLGSARVDQDIGGPRDVDHGTSNGQADTVWLDERTVASGANETIDLRALTNALGEAAAFAEIGELIIEGDLTNTTVLSFGDAASEAFVAPWGGADAVLPVAAGDRFAFSKRAGYAVANDTSDKLYVANASGASAKYRIGIAGRSA
jgi:hypothetical protein